MLPLETAQECPATSPLFTIVTVCLNNVDGVAATAGSVLLQTYKDWEWIIVDGGSTDSTRAYLASLQQKSFRLISEPDRGIYDAMNKGLRISRGHYVIFLNAGDKFASENILATVVHCLGDDKPSLIYGGGMERDGNKSFWKPARSPQKNRYVMFTHHQAIFYETALAKEIGYDLSYRYSADWVLTTRILNKALSVRRYDGAICIFQRGGISQRRDTRKIFNTELFRIYREEQGFSVFKASLCWCLKVSINKFRSYLPSIYDLVRYPESGSSA
jgi:putative colanic acid biosynthesis glycosyltransferase